MNNNNIVPTDEELALLAEAGQEAINRLKEKIRKQATEWKNMDFNTPSIGYMIRPHDGQYIEVPMNQIKKEGE